MLLKSLRLEGESILPSLFTASLAQYDVRLTKTEFTVATRQYVWLPPLKNYSCDSVELKCGCQAQICSKCHRDDAVLDVAGNHGRTCHPGIKSQKATILEKSLDKIFRVAERLTKTKQSLQFFPKTATPLHENEKAKCSHSCSR